MAITQRGSLKKDDNDYPVMGGTSSVDNDTVINSAFDPSTRRLLVDASGGAGGVTVETPVGAINGSNTVYTVSHAPAFVVVDSSSYFETLHYTYAAGTITMNALLAPTQFIRSIY